MILSVLIVVRGCKYSMSALLAEKVLQNRVRGLAVDLQLQSRFTIDCIPAVDPPPAGCIMLCIARRDDAAAGRSGFLDLAGDVVLAEVLLHALEDFGGYVDTRTAVCTR